jgi:hypothetical protein
MDALKINIEFPQGFQRFHFDPKTFKKYLRLAASGVTKDAKRLVSRHAVSKGGDFFGRDTGDTVKAIRARIGFSGWSAVISPSKRSARMQERNFYPTILVYGSKKMVSNWRNKGGKKKRAGHGVLEPRRDPIAEAFDARRAFIRATLQEGFAESLGVV